MSYYKHRKGAGCPQCSGNYQHKAGEFFERRANAVHDGKYRYGNYDKAAKNIEIFCPVHGPFLQTPASHLQGHGCKRCADDEKRLNAKGGYSSEFFALNPDMKEHPATLYIVKFVRASEEFIKLGITRTSVGERYKSGYRKYEIRSVMERRLTLYAAFLLEQASLDMFRPLFQIFPRMDQFVGKTECLSPSCLSELLNWISKALTEMPTTLFSIHGGAMILQI